MSEKKFVNINCPACKSPFDMDLFQAVNVQMEPELKAMLLEGKLNVSNCPSCGKKVLFHEYLLYHDMEKGLWIHCFNPERAPHIEALIRALYDEQVQLDLPLQIPAKIILGMDKLVKLAVMMDSRSMYESLHRKIEDADDKLIYGLLFDMAEEWIFFSACPEYEKDKALARTLFEEGFSQWQRIQQAVSQVKLTLREAAVQAQDGLREEFNGHIEKLRQALNPIESALEICPDFLEAHRLCAWIYDTLGEAGNGIRHFQKCHEIRPNDPSITACLAQIHVHNQAPEKALPFLMRTALLSPQDMNTRFNLGLGFRWCGDMDGARRELEYAAQLADNPKSLTLIREQIQQLSPGLPGEKSDMELS